MEKTILIGGKAQQGTGVTSNFLGRLFCSLGYYAFNYRDYPSLITGGHNFNVLKISDRQIFSHEEQYDVIVALDKETIDLHQKDLKKDGFILTASKNLSGNDSGSQKLKSVETEPVLEKFKLPSVFENNILLGWLFRYFGADKESLFRETKKQFGEKADMVIRTLQEGYDLNKDFFSKEELKKIKGEKHLISGNEAISLGAIAAGLDIYFAYPMTPATPILNFLSKKQAENDILVYQPENEIAVINAALGASFGGAKTMVGSSGGGFALMTEAISLAGMAELPVVVYLGQRTAPSTGVPTYTGQGDLKFALNAGHGEFLKIVVAPGDPQEAILRTQEAFYLSSKYRAPAIILGDKHLGESGYSFDRIENSKISNQRFIVKSPAPDYKSYKVTENGVSPQAVPGQGPVVRATGYEHNEFGNTVEDAATVVLMNNKRLKKLKYVEREIDKMEPVKTYGKGKNLIVSWGSTKGAIIDSMPQLKDFRFLQVCYLNPFPKEKVENEIRKSEKVILVENNSTGLLGQVIRENTGLSLENKILKYDARPFTPDYLVKEVEKI
jgi:2-oxoglutarate ferredoxin oxidoreductase subunit alpha